MTATVGVMAAVAAAAILVTSILVALTMWRDQHHGHLDDDRAGHQHRMDALDRARRR